MNYIEQNLKVNYEVTKAIVRSSAKGEFNGRAYSSSVRIAVKNVYEDENETTNCVDVKDSELIIKVPCKDDLTAGILTTKFNQFFRSGGVLKFSAGLPSFNMGSYTLTTEEDDTFFINYLNNVSSSKSKQILQSRCKSRLDKVCVGLNF